MLVIHLSTFGTEQQAMDTATKMLREAAVRGASIMRATIDGKEIPALQMDPNFNPYRSVE